MFATDLHSSQKILLAVYKWKVPVCSREWRNAEKSDSGDKFWKVGTWQSKATATSATKAEKQRRSDKRGGKEIVLKADFIQYSDHMQLWNESIMEFEVNELT